MSFTKITNVYSIIALTRPVPLQPTILAHQPNLLIQIEEQVVQGEFTIDTSTKQLHDGFLTYNADIDICVTIPANVWADQPITGKRISGKIFLQLSNCS